MADIKNENVSALTAFMVKDGIRQTLLKKASELPLRPGVYIMKNAKGQIIYVGKSKKLKNRVSQYFMNGDKAIKTARMVSAVQDFDYILCDTEMEALALENTLIKKHSPKYNIKLKDAKSYPYIKMTAEEYPRFVFTRTRASDKGVYFGPYTGTSATKALLGIIHKTLGIPSCKRSFPADIGNGRPCIYYEMRQCCGLCTGDVSREEYLSLCAIAANMLKGNVSETIKDLEKKMFAYAEEERYEMAASMRDAVSGLRSIERTQKVVASPNESMDVVGYYRGDVLSGLSIFIIREGALIDKRDFVFGANSILDSSSIVSFLCGIYTEKELIPPSVLLAMQEEDEEIALLSRVLSERSGRRVEVRVPQKGTKHKLCAMVNDNVKEKVVEEERKTASAEDNLVSLAECLSLETLPARIEAWDISNLSYENITAGMIVLENGELKKSDYRIFNIKTVSGTDDYASMQEAMRRRFAHKDDENSSFAILPDLILLDGGRGHVSAIKTLLRDMSISIPCFGMVKDDSHKTRALCTEDSEIPIADRRALFTFIYKIQEEVHRFTVSRMMGSKLRTLKRSALCDIEGIGQTKAKFLLEAMGSMKAVSEASIDELSSIKGISLTNAKNVYDFFHSQTNLYAE